MNQVILIGNLTRDIEIRYTTGGSAVGNTGIAVSRKYKAANGESKEEVLFIDITMFGRVAEIANQYLRKGRKVAVQGRIKLDQWTDQQGQKRSKHGVIVENLEMLPSGSDKLDVSSDASAANGGGYGGAGEYGSGYQSSQGNQGGSGSGHQGGAPTLVDDDLDLDVGAPMATSPSQSSGNSIDNRFPDVAESDEEIPF